LQARRSAAPSAHGKSQHDVSQDGPAIVLQWLRRSLTSMRHELINLLDLGIFNQPHAGIWVKHARIISLPIIADDLFDSVTNMALKGYSHQNWGTSIDLLNGKDNIVEDARRLEQCCHVIKWLCSKDLRQTSSYGRFASYESWDGTVKRRQKGAGNFQLFLATFIKDLVKLGVEEPTYPPVSISSFISQLFLSGESDRSAFERKLAFFSFTLIDGNFVSGLEMTEDLQKEFGIMQSTSLNWMLLLFLDDSWLVDKNTTGNASMNQAIDYCLPKVDAPSLPSQAMEVFLEHNRPEVALWVSKQRNVNMQGKQGMHEACIDLRARLANGLLLEAYLEMKQFLQGTSPSDLQYSIERLLMELLSWGAATDSRIRLAQLPMSSGDEEECFLRLLQEEAATVWQAGVSLTLYYLIRGRLAEAIRAGTECLTVHKADSVFMETHASKMAALIDAATATLPAGVSGNDMQRDQKLCRVHPGEEMSGSLRKEQTRPTVVVEKPQIPKSFLFTETDARRDEVSEVKPTEVQGFVAPKTYGKNRIYAHDLDKILDNNNNNRASAWPVSRRGLFRGR